MYLSVEEYKALALQPITNTDKELIRMIEHAEYLLDVQTRFYYRANPFEDDCAMRKEAVKRALTSQVDFYVESGFTSVYGINTDVDSVTLGRTTVHTSSANGNGPTMTNLTGICQEFWQLLQGTGLLYRGL